jgi:hypothetical protein
LRNVAFDESITLVRGGTREDATFFYIEALREAAGNQGADERDCHVVMLEDLKRLKTMVCPTGAGPDSAAGCDSIVTLPCMAVERTVELLAEQGRCEEARSAFLIPLGNERECQDYFSARLDRAGSDFGQWPHVEVRDRVRGVIAACFARAGVRRDAANEPIVRPIQGVPNKPVLPTAPIHPNEHPLDPVRRQTGQPF